MREEDGTTVWPRLAKNSKNLFRISTACIPAIKSDFRGFFKEKPPGELSRAGGYGIWPILARMIAGGAAASAGFVSAPRSAGSCLIRLGSHGPQGSADLGSQPFSRNGHRVFSRPLCLSGCEAVYRRAGHHLTFGYIPVVPLRERRSGSPLWHFAVRQCVRVRGCRSGDPLP